MANLELAYDEGIKLQTTDVDVYGVNGLDIEEMFLTNKSIICVYEKRTGLFSKPETIIKKWPLSTIKNIAGNIQVSIVDGDYGLALQILFTDGSLEQFVFYDEKKVLSVWKKAVIEAVNECGFEPIKPVNEPAIYPPIPTVQVPQVPVEADKHSELPTNVQHCRSCGAVLSSNAKFCAQCGMNIDTGISPPPVVDKTKRNQEYVGTILKCPHCAAVITELTAICPDCGLPITKRDAVSSVQRFNDQLMELEKSKKQKSGSMMFANLRKVDPADNQKLVLIRNFPIPNSIDDISEFIMLAIANIDVTLSKKTFSNALYSTNNANGETAATIERTISNAWVSKMEQCYHKAEMAFPNHPTFSVIQHAYQEKMRELEGKGIGNAFAEMFKY